MSVQNHRIYAVIDRAWSHGAVINRSSEELSVECDASNVDVGETHMFNLAAQKLVSNFLSLTTKTFSVHRGVQLACTDSFEISQNDTKMNLGENPPG